VASNAYFSRNHKCTSTYSVRGVLNNYYYYYVFFVNAFHDNRAEIPASERRSGRSGRLQKVHKYLKTIPKFTGLFVRRRRWISCGRARRDGRFIKYSSSCRRVRHVMVIHTIRVRVDIEIRLYNSRRTFPRRSLLSRTNRVPVEFAACK